MARLKHSKVVKYLKPAENLLVLTNNKLFWFNVYTYVLNARKWNKKHTISVALYIIAVILEDYIKISYKNKNLNLSNTKNLNLVNNKDLNEWLLFIYNFIMYYTKPNNYYFNLAIIKYILSSVLFKIIFMNDYIFNFILENTVLIYCGLSALIIYKYLKNKYNNYHKHDNDNDNNSSSSSNKAEQDKPFKPFDPFKYQKPSNNFYRDACNVPFKGPGPKDLIKKNKQIFNTASIKRAFIAYNLKKKKFIRYFSNVYIKEVRADVDDCFLRNILEFF